MHITAHSTRLAYGGWLTLAVQDSHLLDHSPFAGRTIPIYAGNYSTVLKVCQWKRHTCNVNREQTLIEVNLTDADEENADFTHFFAEFSLSRVFTDFDMFNKISENLRSDL